MLIAIHTPTSSSGQSIDFYSRLGFQRICEEPLVYTDGKALVEINADRYARAGIKIYDADVNDLRAKMSLATNFIPINEGYLCSDPSGIWIYITHKRANFSFELQESSFGIVGNFAGLSRETTDMHKSCLYYESIGFQKTDGGTVPHIHCWIFTIGYSLLDIHYWIFITGYSLFDISTALP